MKSVGVIPWILMTQALCAGQKSRLLVTETSVRLRHSVQSSGSRPVVLAPRSDGTACLGYSDTRGNLHVLGLDRAWKKRRSFTLKAHRLVGLHAGADGSAVLLASTEEGSNEHRPGWCARGDNTLYILGVDRAGKQTFKTHLLGGRGYGSQQRWFIPGSAGVLLSNGEMYGAFYSVGKNWAKAGQDPDPHEGDDFKAVDFDGDVVEEMSCFWNCSHSMDQRMLVDPDTSEFLTLTMGDTYPVGVLLKQHPSRTRGVVWPAHELVKKLQAAGSKVFFPGNLGGIALDGDALTAAATVFVRDSVEDSKNRSERHALFLRFDKAGKLLARRFLNKEPLSRGVRAYVASIGRHTLVGWGDPARKSMMLGVLDDQGNDVIKPRSRKSAVNRRAGFLNLPGGDPVWVAARSGSKSVTIHRVRVPKSY